MKGMSRRTMLAGSAALLGVPAIVGARARRRPTARPGQTWMVTFDNHILSPAFTPNLAYKDSDLMNVMLVGRAPLAAACPTDRP